MCWNKDPNQRPVSSLSQSLLNLSISSFSQSFNLNLLKLCLFWFVKLKLTLTLTHIEEKWNESLSFIQFSQFIVVFFDLKLTPNTRIERTLKPFVKCYNNNEYLFMHKRTTFDFWIARKKEKSILHTEWKTHFTSGYNMLLHFFRTILRCCILIELYQWNCNFQRIQHFSNNEWISM
jgi:hypothetical protein